MCHELSGVDNSSSHELPRREAKHTPRLRHFFNARINWRPTRYSTVPAGPRSGQFLQISVPQVLFPAGDLIKIVPRIKAGVVTVAEHKANRIISDRFDGPYGYVAFSGHELAFRWRVPLDLRAGAD